MDIGVRGEGASSVSAGAVVVFITDVVRVADGGLLYWVGHWKLKVSEKRGKWEWEGGEEEEKGELEESDERTTLNL